MNKSAVALAADSKVSIGGVGTQKAYDSVNEVFTLSKVHPVGAMVFGNAEFMQYPWETIIKDYRARKGSSSHQTIEKWTDDFISFVRSFGIIEDLHRKQNAATILSSFFEEILETAGSIYNQASQHDDVEIGDLPEAIKALADLRATQLSQDLAITKKSAQDKVLEFNKDVIETVSVGMFSRFFDEMPSEIIDCAVAALLSAEVSRASSGLVIAGFGDEEVFPSLTEHQLDGFVGDHFKSVKTASIDIARGNDSSIRSFAQHDMVQRFMNGFDLKYMLTVQNAFATFAVNAVAESLKEFNGEDEIPADRIEKITTAVDHSLQELFDKMQSVSEAQFSQPVMTMVALLPKEELAHLAESLVALTSLKRKVSQDAETVGGPVDVALISKGDGFVWIKRKHYFQSELNQHFFQNYFRGC